MDDLAIRRKRLLYQSRHRGTQESDLLLGGFAQAHLERFDGEELDQFEALVGQTDADLMDWISGRAAAPNHLGGTVFDLLVTFKNILIEH
ncbi:MAG: succinate dehydrogenase assembly factor 2 [Alphaproteobacteria bacterium]|nr:succinate dehydrogenase assembly factor 2 [Alphaproteobacteria bacterium]MCZ6813036.1 succinate dehydrogenase assembly factor 2 [Alphaproteobacteria bacterium]MCZ6849220.1 succinate dehydrogenase assembly factor 2 [Alphaproteobacteria bacterium]